LLAFDLIWFIAVGGLWTAKIINDDSWNYLYGIHMFAVIMSACNVAFKVGLVLLLNKSKELQSKF
jgi:hypothetical protein